MVHPRLSRMDQFHTCRDTHKVIWAVGMSDAFVRVGVKPSKDHSTLSWRERDHIFLGKKKTKTKSKQCLTVTDTQSFLPGLGEKRWQKHMTRSQKGPESPEWPCHEWLWQPLLSARAELGHILSQHAGRGSLQMIQLLCYVALQQIPVFHRCRKRSEMCCSSLPHNSLEPGVARHPSDTLGAGARSKTLHLWVIKIILFLCWSRTNGASGITGKYLFVLFIFAVLKKMVKMKIAPITKICCLKPTRPLTCSEVLLNIFSSH